jgi:hypothetical protein
VRKGEQVVVCIAEANLDVRSLFVVLSPDCAYCFDVTQKNVFGSDPRAAVFNRTPVENAGILGVEPYGQAE